MEFKQKIGWKMWRICFVDGLKAKYGVDGDCDPPDTKHKAIRVDAALSAWDELETILHEMQHAAYPDLSEDSVTTIASQMRQALSKRFEQPVRKPSVEEVHEGPN